MPYTVTLTRGAVFANIADGTINQTSTMTLIGRDFANYGQFVDQDLIRLLESGAATANNRPTSALTGQLWFDLTNTQLKVATAGNIPNGASYTGNPITWQGVSPAYSGDNAPTQPTIGDTWMYTNTVSNIAQLIVYNGDTSKTTFGNPGWQAVGPLTRNDTVTVNEISGNIGNFQTVTGDGLLLTNEFYANEASFSDTVLIGRDRLGALNTLAYVDARGTAGYYGNLNGDQQYITSIGSWGQTGVTGSGGQLTYIAVGNSNNPGTFTQISGNGIQTAQGIVAQGTSYLNEVAGNSAIFNVIGNAVSQINGVIQPGSKYQPYVRGLGTQEAAFNSAGTLLTGVGLAVKSNIQINFDNAFTGNSNVNIGSDPLLGGIAFSNVYAKLFVGDLQGSLVGNIPAASISDITVPDDGGIYVGGNANSALKTGAIRIDGGNGTGSFNNGVYIGNPNPPNVGLGNIGLVQSWGVSTVSGGIGDILTLTNSHKPSGGSGNVLFDFYKDVRINGNLYVLGNTVQTNVENLTTEDKDITLSDNTTSANLVTGLTGAGVLLGNIANVGASNQFSFTGYAAVSGSLGNDRQRWEMNRSLSISTGAYAATAGSLGDLTVAGNVFAQGTNSNSQFSSATIQNLYVSGSSGYVTGRVNGALGGMLYGNGAVGNAVGTVYNGITYPASEGPDALTTALRDSNGDINAVNFLGTALYARYADLAENYLADRTYVPGTLVTVGGDSEITECGANDYPLGVVSTNPAYLMNTELVGGTPIALRGRVPVRFKGAVSKGDRIGPSDTPGVCARNNSTPAAIALHNAYAEPGTEGIVEAVIL